MPYSSVLGKDKLATDNWLGFGTLFAMDCNIVTQMDAATKDNTGTVAHQLTTCLNGLVQQFVLCFLY